MRLRVLRGAVVGLYTIAEAICVGFVWWQIARGHLLLACLWTLMLVLCICCERWALADLRGLNAAPRDPLVIAWRQTAASLRRESSLLDALGRATDGALADKAADVFACCADQLDARR